MHNVREYKADGEGNLVAVEVQLLANVQAETLTVEVGDLTIKSGPVEPGRIAAVFDSKVLFNGKEPDLRITRIELIGDVDAGPWVCKLYGFPKGS